MEFILSIHPVVHMTTDLSSTGFGVSGRCETCKGVKVVEADSMHVDAKFMKDAGETLRDWFDGHVKDAHYVIVLNE